jgi:hypothetical protein
MEKVKRLIDKQLDTEMGKEADLCLTKLRCLESALWSYRERLKVLLEGGTEGLGKELGIIEGKTGDTISALYLIERTNELIQDTTFLWGDTLRKYFDDYLKQEEEN